MLAAEDAGETVEEAEAAEAAEAEVEAEVVIHVCHPLLKTGRITTCDRCSYLACTDDS